MQCIRICGRGMARNASTNGSISATDRSSSVGSDCNNNGPTSHCSNNNINAVFSNGKMHETNQKKPGKAPIAKFDIDDDVGHRPSNNTISNGQIKGECPQDVKQKTRVRDSLKADHSSTAKRDETICEKKESKLKQSNTINGNPTLQNRNITKVCSNDVGHSEIYASRPSESVDTIKKIPRVGPAPLATCEEFKDGNKAESICNESSCYKSENSNLNKGNAKIFNDEVGCIGKKHMSQNDSGFRHVDTLNNENNEEYRKIIIQSLKSNCATSSSCGEDMIKRSTLLANGTNQLYTERMPSRNLAWEQHTGVTKPPSSNTIKEVKLNPPTTSSNAVSRNRVTTTQISNSKASFVKEVDTNGLKATGMKTTGLSTNVRMGQYGMKPTATFTNDVGRYGMNTTPTSNNRVGQFDVEFTPMSTNHGGLTSASGAVTKTKAARTKVVGHKTTTESTKAQGHITANLTAFSTKRISHFDKKAAIAPTNAVKHGDYKDIGQRGFNFKGCDDVMEICSRGRQPLKSSPTGHQRTKSEASMSHNDFDWTCDRRWRRLLAMANANLYLPDLVVKHYAVLVKQMFPESVIHYLYQRKVIIWTEKEEIGAMDINYKKNDKILFKITKGTNEMVLRLYEALRQSDQEYLANLLFE